MKIDILTLFPDMFAGPFATSMLKKAQDMGLLKINIHNLRNWTKDSHRTVDDRPYGGGKGMVLMVEPIYNALQDLKQKSSSKRPYTILLSPQGKVFNQKLAQSIAKMSHLIFIAGHYEGFDERIADHLVDSQISIGDYILTGGELPAMVIVDTVTRLLPGVLDPEATANESFSPGLQPSALRLLDFPQYTRPEVFKNWRVPDILLTGNHAEIAKWREKEALKKTKRLRPDLLRKKP